MQIIPYYIHICNGLLLADESSAGVGLVKSTHQKRLPFGSLFLNGARTPAQTIKYRLNWRDETEESRMSATKKDSLSEVFF